MINCTSTESCPFYLNDGSNPLFNRLIWRKVAEQREDAYSVLFDAFKSSLYMSMIIVCQQTKIEDATSSATIRFGDAIHFLYHEDNSITWEKVITKVDIHDTSLARVIRNSI